MIMKKNVRDCFVSALKEEKRGRKHKGLLKVKPSIKEAEGYVLKAKKNLIISFLKNGSIHFIIVP